MGRFEDVTDDVIELLSEVRNEAFPELRNAKIKVLFDTKKRKLGGDLVIGRMTKTNDLIRHLTSEESGEPTGYDYIMYVDKAAYENVEKVDKVRILRHELQHCDVDLDSNTNPYKLRPHEISDFHDEIEFNRDDPRWAERVAAVAESVYSRDDD